MPVKAAAAVIAEAVQRMMSVVLLLRNRLVMDEIMNYRRNFMGLK